MKVVIVNTYDIYGGAARAAYRLHKSLLAEGVDSQMLVQNKISDDITVSSFTGKYQKVKNYIGKYIDSIPVKFYKNRSKTYFSSSMVSISNISSQINAFEPDIVHLHWVCDGMISIKDIAKIKAPIVWSLHDMWPFTGGCHYDEECGKYLNSCEACRVLKSDKKNDLSSYLHNKKQKSYAKINSLTMVGLSNWLTICALNSQLARGRNVVNLPNPIDTKVFKPFNKVQARVLWNLPQNKKLIMFGAIAANSDPRKGFKELKKSLDLLNYKDVEFVLVGSSQSESSNEFSCKTHYLGVLHDDISLVTLYSAVDVLVVPSLQENLSNMIMESLSCGTSVVAFDIGGNSDMIEHKKNGYLAVPFDSQDLAKGIQWVITNKGYDALSMNAVKKVKSTFEAELVAKQYIALYKSILEKEAK